MIINAVHRLSCNRLGFFSAQLFAFLGATTVFMAVFNQIVYFSPIYSQILPQFLNLLSIFAIILSIL